MAVSPALLRAPVEPLFRVARRPYAAHFPPLKKPGEVAYHRYDDTQHRFAVLYAAEERGTCFLELLQNERPTQAMLEARRRTRAQQKPRALRAEWATSREEARLQVRTPLPFLDMRAAESVEAARAVPRVSQALRECGIAAPNVHVVLGKDREVTQAIAAWAYDKRCAGVVYASCTDVRKACWAVFQRPETQVQVLDVRPLSPRDTDLLRTLALYRIPYELQRERWRGLGLGE